MTDAPQHTAADMARIIAEWSPPNDPECAAQVMLLLHANNSMRVDSSPTGAVRPGHAMTMDMLGALKASGCAEGPVFTSYQNRIVYEYYVTPRGHAVAEELLKLGYDFVKPKIVH